MTHDVEIVTAPSRTVVVSRFHVPVADLPDLGDRMGRAFATVMGELGAAQLTSDGPAIAYYEPSPGGFNVAAGFPVPASTVALSDLDRIEVGGMPVAHTTHIGPYSELQSAYSDLREQVDAVGAAIAPDGPMWEEYWSPPDTPEDQARTEIYWPVLERAEV